MTKEQVIEAIKNEIHASGFQPEMNERISPLPILMPDDDSYVAMNIRERWDEANSDFENRIAAYKVEVQVSVKRMGGEPTPEELLKASDEIRRGAELMRKLQNLNLAYTIKL